MQTYKVHFGQWEWNTKVSLVELKRLSRKLDEMSNRFFVADWAVAPNFYTAFSLHGHLDVLKFSNDAD